MNIRSLWIIGVFVASMFVASTAVYGQQPIPATVKSVAVKKAEGRSVLEWVVDKERGKYLAVLDDGAVVEVSMNGKWLSTMYPVSIKQLPAAVATTVRSYEAKGYDVDNFLRVDDAQSGQFYFVDLTSDDEDATLTIDPKGKMIKKEPR